jgi:uncharacterized protein (TIGR00730 family)
MHQVITVFGSAQSGAGDSAYEEAERLGSALAREGYVLCNGGYGGTMEASAKGAHASGGTTIGVTMSTLPRTANAWITRTIEKPSLIERLQTLVDLGDGYVVLGGGTGTLLELALVWELLTKHLMQPKPIVCLGQFWSPLVHVVKEQLVREGRPSASEAVTLIDSVEECVRVFNNALR